jgi:hypothetical protein
VVIVRAPAGIWVVAVALVAAACDDKGPSGPSVGVELFSADFRSAGQGPTPIDLHTGDVGDATADVLEVVVADPQDTASPPTVELQTADGRGKLVGLAVGRPTQIFIRGFQGSDNRPLLYGASDLFTVGDDDTRAVGVQVGRADCVGLNAAAASATSTPGYIDMSTGREGSTMTLMPDGRVLIIGGATVDASGDIAEIHDSVELYDPNAGKFVPSNVALLEPRAWHSATYLGDGRVLVFGGLTTDPNSGERRVASDAYIVDLANEAAPVQRVAGVLDAGFERYRHEATLIRSSTGELSVLFTGGFGADGKPQQTVLRYFPSATDDPTRGEFVPQGQLCDARVRHTATALLARAGELAVVAGGLRQKDDGSYEPLGSVEVFSVNPRQQCVCSGMQPHDRVGCFVKPAGRVLETPRWGHRAVRVDDDRQVLFVGGYASADRAQLARGLEMLDLDLEMHGSAEVGSLPRGAGELTATAIPVDFFADGPDGACDPEQAGTGAGVCRPEHQVLITGGRRGDAAVTEVLRLVPRRMRDAQQAQVLQGFGVKELPEECALSEARFDHEAVRLRTGSVLLGGGILGPAGHRAPSRRGEIYFPLASNLRALYPTEASLSARPIP